MGIRVGGCSSSEKSLSGGTLSPFLKWTKKNLALCDNMDEVNLDDVMLNEINQTREEKLRDSTCVRAVK